MGQTITFAQQKGGAGKTTVLAHLAAAWAEAGHSVALIDLDPQRSLSRWAEVRGDDRIDLVESKDYRAGSDMKSAARTHEYVLVDCPGAASSMLDAAIRESHIVVAPCQPSVMDVWATRHFTSICLVRVRVSAVSVSKPMIMEARTRIPCLWMVRMASSESATL